MIKPVFTSGRQSLVVMGWLLILAVLILSGCLPHSKLAETVTSISTLPTETPSSPLLTRSLPSSTPTVTSSVIMSGRIAYVSRPSAGYTELNLISIKCSDSQESCSKQFLQLANDVDYGSSPAWSPDGKTINFVSFGNTVTPVQQIDVINADGTERKRLTYRPSSTKPSAYYEAIWSLDGGRIAFISWGEGVYVMNRDGSGLTTLIDVKCASYGGCSTYPHALSWSPDGARLAVDVWMDGGFEYVGILDASGGQKIQDDQEIAEWSMDPAWSPNGSRLAYTCFRETLNPDICTTDVQTGKETRLTNKPGRDAKPVWSPDGKRLAFVSSRDGNWDIYTMNADGSAQTNLTRSPSRDSEPAWSPDGQLIAFQSCRDDPHPVACASPCGDNYEEDDGIVSCNNQIYVMNADGSGQIRLTKSPNDDTHPVWAPK